LQITDVAAICTSISGWRIKTNKGVETPASMRLVLKTLTERVSIRAAPQAASKVGVGFPSPVLFPWLGPAGRVFGNGLRESMIYGTTPLSQTALRYSSLKGTNAANALRIFSRYLII